ncbi:MAG: hypothetical protein II304_06130 [Bacteroidales bacterium]|nr:hypothetical protein [Bacteroidales bacterium]
MSYNYSEIEKMLKAMALVTTGSGMNIDKLVDLYASEPKAPEDTPYPVQLEHLDFMRKHIIDGKLKITEENVEALLEEDPNAFKGIKVEFIDYNDKDYFDEEEVDG